MRLSSFLLISAALHATALTYPVAFVSPPGEELIPIMVLSLGDGSAEGAAGDNRAEGKKGKPAGPRRPAAVDKADQTSKEQETTTESKSPTGISLGPAEVAEEAAIAPSSALPTATGGNFSRDYGTGNGGDAGHGRGISGAGNGAGVGRGEGSGGSHFVQVSYAYSPKPEYPERARKEGKEGTVLLRVLVDDQGRSRWVELSRSSGFEALDQAALNAIKRWRFSPALNAEKAVESWIKIPIVFRLTDLKE